jgi:hypothetical protein
MMMTLSSTTFRTKFPIARSASKKKRLLKEHQEAVDKVVEEAKSFTSEREEKLKTINSRPLRQRATL